MLRPAEFESTFAQGSRITRKPIGLVFIANSKGRPRLGLAISKKAVALSTRRNRLKRLIREAFRRAVPRLPGVDVVIYAQPGAGTADSEQLRHILTQLWAKVAERCASS